MPRVKPPRTVEQGLFDMPTVLNNVETFANVPLLSKTELTGINPSGLKKSGNKSFCADGQHRNTGLIEIPMGTTLRKLYLTSAEE